jgi:hypothetical protein
MFCYMIFNHYTRRIDVVELVVLHLTVFSLVLEAWLGLVFVRFEHLLLLSLNLSMLVDQLKSNRVVFFF